MIDWDAMLTTKKGGLVVHTVVPVVKIGGVVEIYEILF